MSYAFGGMIPSTGYDNPAPENVAYRLKVALDRDNRLNTDEKRIYDDGLVEHEFGSGFFRRAHP